MKWHKHSDALGWSEGHEGKGYLLRNGVIRHWNVDPYNPEDHQTVHQRNLETSPIGLKFEVDPDGGIVTDRPTPKVESIVAADPRLYDAGQRPEGEFELGELEPKKDAGPDYNFINSKWHFSDGPYGYTNWDTSEFILTTDNDRELNEAIRKLVEQGAGPEEIRDWAIKNVIGPYNKERMQDAQEWNEIPLDERKRRLRERDVGQFGEEAVNLGDSLMQPFEDWANEGKSPEEIERDEEYDEPNLIDPELVNWDEVQQDILNEFEENAEHDRSQQEREQRMQQQGLDFRGDWDDENEDHMVNAMYKHHGAKPESWFEQQGIKKWDDPRWPNNVVVRQPYEHLQQLQGYPDSFIHHTTRANIWGHQADQIKKRRFIELQMQHPDWDPEHLREIAEGYYRHAPLSEKDTPPNMNDSRIAEMVDQDPNIQEYKKNGYPQRLPEFTRDVVYAIQRGQDHPAIPMMQEALAQQGYTPEQITQYMQQKRRWDPEADQWIDLAGPPVDKWREENKNQQMLDQPGNFYLPPDWTSSTKESGSWDPTVCENCGAPMGEPRLQGNRWVNSCTHCRMTRDVPTSNPLLKQWNQNWPPYPDLLQEVAQPRPWIESAWDFKTSGMTLNQEIRHWQGMAPSSGWSLVDHLPDTGYSIRHHQSDEAVRRVGEMMRNCWQGAQPEDMREGPYVDPRPPIPEAQWMAMHDEHGIPRAAFYQAGQTLYEPMGMRNNILHPNYAGPLAQWATQRGLQIVQSPSTLWNQNDPDAWLDDNNTFYQERYHPEEANPELQVQSSINPATELQEWLADMGQVDPPSIHHETEEDMALRPHVSPQEGLSYYPPGHVPDQYKQAHESFDERPYLPCPECGGPMEYSQDHALDYNMQGLPEHVYSCHDCGHEVDDLPFTGNPDVDHHIYRGVYSKQSDILQPQPVPSNQQPVQKQGPRDVQETVHTQIQEALQRGDTEMVQWLTQFYSPHQQLMGFPPMMASEKKAMPANPDWWKTYAGEGPLYHGTTIDRLGDIKEHGLLPWDHPGNVGGSQYGNEFELDPEEDWLTPRPGHTYLTPDIERAARHSTGPKLVPNEWSAMLRIDPTFLDPQHINPDEDHMGIEGFAPGQGPEDYSHEYKSLGDAAEAQGWGNDLGDTQNAIDNWGGIAYRGPIPWDAIHPMVYRDGQWVDWNETAEDNPSQMVAKTAGEDPIGDWESEGGTVGSTKTADSPINQADATNDPLGKPAVLEPSKKGDPDYLKDEACPHCQQVHRPDEPCPNSSVRQYQQQERKWYNYDPNVIHSASDIPVMYHVAPSERRQRIEEEGQTARTYAHPELTDAQYLQQHWNELGDSPHDLWEIQHSGQWVTDPEREAAFYTDQPIPPDRIRRVE